MEILIIPSFGKYRVSLSTLNLVRVLSGDYGHVRVIPIHWINKTFTEWLTDVDTFISSVDVKDKILIGIGEGALLAMMVASRQTPYCMILHATPRVVHRGMPYTDLLFRRQYDFYRYNPQNIMRMIVSPIHILVNESDKQQKNQIWEQAQYIDHHTKNCTVHVVRREGLASSHYGVYYAMNGVIWNLESTPMGDSPGTF